MSAKNTNNDGLMEELRKIFLTIEIFNVRFTPVEKIVYTFISLILVAFVTALIALVIRK